MVHTCAVFKCKNNSKDNPKLQWFRVPLSPSRRERWLDLMGRKELMNEPERTLHNRRVCSEHFIKSMFAGMSESRLKQNAEPTIFKENCGYKDKDNAAFSDEDDITESYQIPTQSVSTQTATSLTLWKVKYQDKMKMLRSENRSLERRVEKLENVVEDVMENITLEQYQELTYKFCSSKEIANFVNIQVAQNHKLPRDRGYLKEFKD